MDDYKNMNVGNIGIPGHRLHLKGTGMYIDCYEKIGWFRRLMLRWLLGFEYVKVDVIAELFPNGLRSAQKVQDEIDLQNSIFMKNIAERKED